MILRNKKTGQIGSFIINKDHIECVDLEYVPEYSTLAELNKEWEDVPEEVKDVWFIDAEGAIDACTRECEYDELGLDAEDMKEIGNYFETEEEAKKAVEKLKAWKRLKEAGFKFTDWYRDVCDVSIQAEIHDEGTMGMINDLNILFGGEE